MCAPPIRKKEDQDCLWDALKKEDIQTVATDQCSFTLDQKALGRDDLQRSPADFREYRLGERCFIPTVSVPERSRKPDVQIFMRKSRKALWGISEKGVIREAVMRILLVLDPERKV